MKHIFLPALAALLCAGASAQTLKQEITVDHEVVPERRDVSRLTLTPAVTLPSVEARQLEYSNRSANITVPPSITPLEPAAWSDTIYTTPWRGYLMAGIMPLFNADLSAGYKFIDNDHTRFAGFLQYNGSLYRGSFPTDDFDKSYIRRHTATLDLMLHQAVGKKSFVDAGVDFMLSRYNMPGFGDEEPVLTPQLARRLGVQATWLSSVGSASYSAGLKFSHFGFSNTVIDNPLEEQLFRPVHENNIGINGKFRYPLDDMMSSVGAELDLNIVNNNRRTDALFSPLEGAYEYFDRDGSYNHALLTLRPYYRFDYRNFRLNLGARVDVTIHSGKVFHIAPDVLVSWRPSWLFAIFAKAGGGEHQNTLSSLYGVTPYTQTMMAYANSHVPLTFDGGITFGSWRGAFAEFGIGYARANDWLMPVTDATALTIFKAVNIRGWHWRAEAGYKYRDMGSISISYEGTQQGYEKGYYLWRDRAKTVIGAHLKVTPIKPLDITADYELRTGRTMIDMEKSGIDGVDDYYADYSLGRISCLNLGATYRLTESLSAFIYGNNLLNTKYRHIGLVPGQGINGLVGISLKF